MIAKKLWSLVGMMLIFSIVAAGCGSGTAGGPAASSGSSSSNTSSDSGAATGATAASGEGSGGGTASGGDTSGNLRIIWWGSQDRHDRTIKAIQLFEQQ